MRFKNKLNGYIETPSVPWFWTLLFGGFYFAFKGIWGHFFLWIAIFIILVVAGIVYAAPNLPILMYGYAFFANSIVRKHYLWNNWVELDNYNNSISGM